MPLLFVPMVGLLGILIALYRRDPKRFLDGPAEDAPLRLLRWAVGLLSPARAEWGQAMLGELDHIDGRFARTRFALGCVGAALVLPPWGRGAATVWAVLALGAGGVGLCASLTIEYGLGAGDWVAAAILTVFVVGCLLGASALVRRPGVAVTGVLGGLVVALVWLTLGGFTFYDQILPDIVRWHPWVEAVVLPFVVGAGGTLWVRDPLLGKSVARLAAITAGLVLYLYSTIAVAVIGSSGPLEEDGGMTLRGTIGDRLGHNLIFLVFTTMVVATVGWGGAAAAGRLLRRIPARPTVKGPLTPQAETRQGA
jgi:hypothetical protein